MCSRPILMCAGGGARLGEGVCAYIVLRPRGRGALRRSGGACAGLGFGPAEMPGTLRVPPGSPPHGIREDPQGPATRRYPAADQRRWRTRHAVSLRRRPPQGARNTSDDRRMQLAGLYISHRRSRRRRRSPRIISDCRYSRAHPARPTTTNMPPSAAIRPIQLSCATMSSSHQPPSSASVSCCDPSSWPSSALGTDRI